MKKALLIILSLVAILPAIAGISEDFYYGKFNSAFNSLNLAMTQSIAKNGPVSSWDWTKSETEIFNQYLRPYLNIQKTCAENDGSCWAASAYMAMNQHAADAPDGLHKSYILSDGTYLVFEARNNDCLGKNDGKVKSCAFVWVDTTGEKFPNVMGRDYFKFYIHPKSSQILPVGYPHSKEIDMAQINKSCNPDSTGNFCGAKLLVEKRMNY